MTSVEGDFTNSIYTVLYFFLFLLIYIYIQCINTFNNYVITKYLFFFWYAAIHPPNDH